MSSAEVIPAVYPQLPIFPLPGLQLFPHALLPLHVFEPRYRELVRDCVARVDAPLLAIATLEPGFEADYEGRPPVKPVCGVGRVIAHEPLGDGRANILLRGLARVRITEELAPERAYRLVRARSIFDRYPEANDLTSALATLVALTDQLALRLPTGGDTLRTLARSQSDAGALVDVIAAALVTEADARQELLENADVSRRIELVTAHLAEVLTRFARSTGPAN